MVDIRKIQVTGGSTYIISLPHTWIENNGLGKGSQVFISEQGKNLELSSANISSRERVKSMNISNSSDRAKIQRALVSLYISNFDILTIRSREYLDQPSRDFISTVARSLMGTEIVEETANTIVLQNVLNGETFSMENAIRRMILVVDTMVQDTLKGLQESSAELMGNVIRRDDDVDRYHWYIYRETMETRNVASEKIFYFTLSRILERIADHAVNICSIFLGRSIRSEIDKNLISLLRTALDMFQKSTKIFFSDDIDSMNDLVEMKELVRNQVKSISDELLKKRESGFISLEIEEISRIALYSTDIAELAMDRISFSSETISV
ncbi:MAG: phosphate uptake regulator PhoU [Candidatus Thermoplasmatota archaeon]|nr:phosphate uptake regulator PhoU [Candidatus Thermoplasmatota archaeon]MCL5665378.1 phosphate uptake regulator PhoU [Candidatus Thermoplasmatota archaeon]